MDGPDATFQPSRRAFVAAGVKLAYAAPAVAAALRLAPVEAACQCPPGSVAVPATAIAALKKQKLTKLAGTLENQCIGCKSGALKVPKSAAAWLGLVKKVNKVCPSCPGKTNRVALVPPTCGGGISGA